MLVNAVGCDSVAKAKVLAIKDTSESTVNAAVCSKPVAIQLEWKQLQFSRGHTPKLLSTLLVAIRWRNCKAGFSDQRHVGKHRTIQSAVCPAQSLPYNWNGNNYSISRNFYQKRWSTLLDVTQLPGWKLRSSKTPPKAPSMLPFAATCCHTTGMETTTV